MDDRRTLQLAKKAFEQHIDTIQNLSDTLDNAFIQCAHMIAQTRGIIWITGIGTSAAVGERFAHLLTCCGARSMYLSPSDGLHGHTGVLSSQDIIIGLSRGGESSEVNQMLEIAHTRGVTTIAMVNNTESSLAVQSDYVLPVKSKQEYELMGYVATTSTVAYSAMADAICEVVREVTGYTPEDFGKTHPGGAVGKKIGSEQ
jgi:arabinose-5-phosphate isomerase